jgi:exopolyphosphatase/guanosine-5'-triphosphate,3'-diphosphate pyrophosphatase
VNDITNGTSTRVIGTSALRAARNRDIFIDRVKQETGFHVHIVEGIEENRLMYLAVRWALKNDLPQFWKANAIILDVGGGSTELMLLRRGRMVAAHSLRIGTILIERAAQGGEQNPVGMDRYVTDSLRNTAALLSSELDLNWLRVFVAAGSFARVAGESVGRELNENCLVMKRDDFLDFVDTVHSYSPAESRDKFGISLAEAETLQPALQVTRFLLEKTQAAQVIAPNVSIREGILIDRTQGVDPRLQEEFFKQITASAISLGRKFHFDEAHALQVARLSMRLFDSLQKEHGMNRRDRCLLETAAILHDIGMFIRASGHQLHGQYIVENSEIFGIHPDELAIIANVVRYHRGDAPQNSDIDYISLQRQERVLVLKLAAILRVADALDRGHSQTIKKISVERKSETVVIHAHTNSSGDALRTDLALENRGLQDKAGLFQNVFGFKVILE